MIVHIRKLILFGLLLVLSTSTVYSSKIDVNNFYGTWVVKSFKFGSAISVYDSVDASKFLDFKIILHENEVNILNDVCDSPKYIFSEEENAFNFLSSFYKERDNSVLDKEAIQMIEVSCYNQPVFGNSDSLNFDFTFFYLNEHSLMFPLNGTYFILEKENIKEEREILKGEQKLLSKTIKIHGKGDVEKNLSVEKFRKVKLEYNFYKIPNMIEIIDENGNMIFSTDLISTKGYLEEELDVSNVKTITVRVSGKTEKISSFKVNVTNIE